MLAFMSQEFKFLHLKSQCKMLIGVNYIWDRGYKIEMHGGKRDSLNQLQYIYLIHRTVTKISRWQLCALNSWWRIEQIRISLALFCTFFLMKVAPGYASCSHGGKSSAISPLRQPWSYAFIEFCPTAIYHAPSESNAQWLIPAHVCGPCLPVGEEFDLLRS